MPRLVSDFYASEEEDRAAPEPAGKPPPTIHDKYTNPHFVPSPSGTGPEFPAHSFPLRAPGYPMDHYPTSFKGYSDDFLNPQHSWPGRDRPGAGQGNKGTTDRAPHHSWPGRQEHIVGNPGRHGGDKVRSADAARGRNHKHRICLRFLQGCCPRKQCKFAHVDSASREELETAMRGFCPPTKYKTELCAFYPRGECTRGAMCTFVH